MRRRATSARKLLRAQWCAPGDHLIRNDPLRSLEIELRRSGRPSAPTQEDADIARHAARIVDDLVAHVVALWLWATLAEVDSILLSSQPGVTPPVVSDRRSALSRALCAGTKVLFCSPPTLAS
jgi:hypothetical protein